MAERFYPIGNVVETGGNPDIHRYGTRPVLYGEETKPLRKLHGTVKRLEQSGLFSEGVQIQNAGIMHGKEGDPSFVRMDNNGVTSFVSARVVQEKDGRVFTNSDFDLNLEEEPTQFITGVCLFGAQTAVGTTESGAQVSLTDPYTVGSFNGEDGKITKLDIDRKIHPYEADTIYRVSRFLRNLASQDATMQVHIPRIEYLLYGREFMNSGAMDRDIFDKWSQEVDRRANGIFQLLDRRTPGRKAVMTAPLEPVEEVIRRGGGVDDMKEILAKDKIWNYLLANNNAESFTDIGYLSYIHAYLSHSEGGALVAVENPEEQTIIVKAKNNIDAIDSGAIIGLYVHPNLLTALGDKKWLYYHPNHDGLMVETLKEVARANEA